MDNALLYQLYQHLPQTFRDLAASAKGCSLRWWRYGVRSEQLVEEALDRETWSSRRWKEWQEKRLAFILDRAATKVPFYREQWAKRRRHGDRSSWEYLENWPVLEKDELRKKPETFIADDRNKRYMYHLYTSGTTGTPLNLWWSRKTVQAWYALFEARWRRWHDVSRHDRWAILGGQLITPVNQNRPPFWVYNTTLNQLYMSSYHLSPKMIPYYLDALQRYRIKYIYAYTSSVNALAQEMIKLERKDLKMAVVITNAEPLFDYQRQAISEAFQCPVRETYGMAEGVMAAGECQEGNLHLWPEVGSVEILEGEKTVRKGETGDFICTGLMNSDMPLIRFRVGDRGAYFTTNITCTCGRNLPTLASVEGRTDDLLYTPDGRRIGRLDPIFKFDIPIREAQIIQERLNLMRLRFVTMPGFTADSARSIVEQLKARMGTVEVILEEVKEIPRTANGKFRAVVCNLPKEDRLSITLNVNQ